MPLWPRSGAPSPREAMALQGAWRERVVCENRFERLECVGGVDVSVVGESARAAICVFSWPDLQPLECATATLPVEFPYVPGLLGFREVPAVAAAFARLARRPDLLIVDGQGRAHPRRFGVATHVGVELDVPAIGCAKTCLVGEHRPVGARRGSRARLVHGGETVGVALRTREGVREVYVSTGHRVDLATAARIVLAGATRYRLPEPIRAAHRAASLAG
ncbi:MAG TPA: deoxyribonuclease V [Planctomycetota bacterium]|nr:deoxyribonuclease V [Planctomycetota bacterium]